MRQILDRMKFAELAELAEARAKAKAEALALAKSRG
jgi:hypothetical protein